MITNTEKAIEGHFPTDSTLDFLKQDTTEKSNSKYAMKSINSQRNMLLDRANYYCHFIVHEIKRLKEKKIHKGIGYLHASLIKKMCQVYYDYNVAKSYVEFVHSIKCENTQKIFADIFRLYVAHKIYTEGEYFRNLIGKEVFEDMPTTIVNL